MKARWEGTNLKPRLHKIASTLSAGINSRIKAKVAGKMAVHR